MKTMIMKTIIMKQIMVLFKLLPLVGFLAFAIPLQMLCLWRGWPLARWLPVYVHRLFLTLIGVRIHLSGITPQGRSLVVSNHVSWLDISVLGAVMPLSFIAKSEVAGWPVIGTFAKLQRSIFIDRARKKETLAANHAIARRLTKGDVMVLFAEGTTSDGNRVMPFRSSLIGAAQAALGANDDSISLQPLAIVYTHRNGLPLTRRDRPHIAWYGDMALGPHLLQCLMQGPIDVKVIWAPSLAFGVDADRKKATSLSERAVRRSLEHHNS
jgi:lyso-ornithine lipid O-acyltransferase